MSLPVVNIGVDYELQQESFNNFLKNFKSVTSTEEVTRDALSHLHMDDKDEDIESNDTPRRRSTRSGRRETRRQAPEPKLKYMEQLQEIANRERQALTIELEDLKEYEANSSDALRLVKSIEQNAAHYVDIISRAVDAVMPEQTIDTT